MKYFLFISFVFIMFNFKAFSTPVVENESSEADQVFQFLSKIEPINQNHKLSYDEKLEIIDQGNEDQRQMAYSEEAEEDFKMSQLHCGPISVVRNSDEIKVTSRVLESYGASATRRYYHELHSYIFGVKKDSATDERVIFSSHGFYKNEENWVEKRINYDNTKCSSSLRSPKVELTISKNKRTLTAKRKSCSDRFADDVYDVYFDDDPTPTPTPTPTEAFYSTTKVYIKLSKSLTKIKEISIDNYVYTKLFFGIFNDKISGIHDNITCSF